MAAYGRAQLSAACLQRVPLQSSPWRRGLARASGGLDDNPGQLISFLNLLPDHCDPAAADHWHVAPGARSLLARQSGLHVALPYVPRARDGHCRTCPPRSGSTDARLIWRGVAWRDAPLAPARLMPGCLADKRAAGLAGVQKMPLCVGGFIFWSLCGQYTDLFWQNCAKSFKPSRAAGGPAPRTPHLARKCGDVRAGLNSKR